MRVLVTPGSPGVHPRTTDITDMEPEYAVDESRYSAREVG